METLFPFPMWLADSVIAASLLIILAALVYIHVKRKEHRRSETALVTFFSLFMLAAALVSVASLLGLWAGAEAFEGLLKAAAALLALATAIAIWMLTPQLWRLPERDRLQADAAAHLREELRTARAQLAEREATEDQLRLLLRELTHRSKNLLAVIQAIARHTAARTQSMDDFLQAFSARLVAMGCSHDVLVADDWQGASLRHLIEQQLNVHAERFGKRIMIEGADVSLKPEVVQNLGLALHELATNAQKYGALSTEQGRVRIHWQFCSKDASKLRLVWEERGGPPVSAPERRGFGRAMVENVVGKALAGDVTLSFPAKGVRCVIDIPAEQIAARS